MHAIAPGKWLRYPAAWCILALLFIAAVPQIANAIADGCAVVLKTPDGFLNLRQGPATNFRIIAKLYQGDVLHTASCEIAGGEVICDGTDKWTHVTSVPRLDGDSTKSRTFGWVSNKYVQWFHCPD
jgi:hypothetical protein